MLLRTRHLMTLRLRCFENGNSQLVKDGDGYLLGMVGCHVFTAMSRNDHGFDIHEFADAEAGKLAAVAAVFHTTERQLGVRGYCCVDEHRNGFDAVRGEAL